MRSTKAILASATAMIVLASPAFAQQAADGKAGMVTQIDRLNGTMTIQQMQDGTVGANGGAAEQFKVQDAQVLENFHAGDRVTFSATDNNNGVKTITKMQKQ